MTDEAREVIRLSGLEKPSRLARTWSLTKPYRFLLALVALLFCGYKLIEAIQRAQATAPVYACEQGQKELYSYGGYRGAQSQLFCVDKKTRQVFMAKRIR
jgi:hypothetical protein